MKKIAERVEELSHAALDSTDPPPTVDMSQVLSEIVEPRKGRVIGLGNLAPTRIGSTSSASISSNIDPAVLDSLFEERFGERLVKMQQEMQEKMNEQITLAVHRALSGHQMMDNPHQQNVNGSDGHDDDFGG